MLLLTLLALPLLAQPATIDLAGTWRSALDPDDLGRPTDWPHAARLPGSLDQAGLGQADPPTPTFAHLHREHAYTGAAWYQREVRIPADWAGRRVTLSLERAHWATEAWLDDQPLGRRESLCVPHDYDLGTNVAPGRRTLTLRVDNRMIHNVGGWAHSVTDETQTNWNGVIGQLELRAGDPVWLDALRVYPDLARRVVRVEATVGNATGAPVSGTVAGVPFNCPGATTQVEALIAVPTDLQPYDEFTRATAELTVELAAGAWRDSRTVRYGLRELSTAGGRLRLNGSPHMLRGTLECCIFPRTGYPPTDVASWRRIVRICADYGLNHLRFHSWCPPRAAFEAADEAGFLLQVELPVWTGDLGHDAPRDAFLQAEFEAILAAYGNHPSFAILCLGNELGGDLAWMEALVRHGQATDPRRLYTSSTAWSHVPANDLDVSVIRGLRGPRTDHDFAGEQPPARPQVSHEVGQWMVFPNLAERRKYTGWLRPRNFEATRDLLAANGLADQAATFTRASGRLAAELYKEEIEVLLRTPGHGGFQLLDLHDFPGQHTSLVGVLDAFWDSKGLITPAQWRRFCAPTVPLLRLTKRTWASDEPLVATAQLAHFGPADAPAASAHWRALDDRGRTVAAGELPPVAAPRGELTTLGEIRVDLAAVEAPARLRIEVSRLDLGAANDWSVWVYPAAPTAADEGAAPVLETDDWSAARAALAAGGRVLLDARRILRQPVVTRLEPPFWNPIMFANQPRTFGQVVDTRHPALAAFPSAEHSDWQWSEPLSGARAMLVGGLGLRPIVAAIDAHDTGRPLAMAFEARVGEGRLLAHGWNLTPGDEEPRLAARALADSLRSYTRGSGFAPRLQLDAAQLDALFMERPPQQVAGPPAAGQHLRVRAAAALQQRQTNVTWSQATDIIETRAPGFDYRVTQGQTWLDATGSSWHDNEAVRVALTVPAGWAGTVYVFLWDWNNLNRAAAVELAGREVAQLPAYDDEGVWLALPVTAEETAGGSVELVARALAGNAMISELVLAGGE